MLDDEAVQRKSRHHGASMVVLADINFAALEMLTTVRNTNLHMLLQAMM